MRSEGVAWLCADCGLKPQVLRGGYKSFRRAAHDSFAKPLRIVVLAGHTGSGKTRLLSLLRGHGQQVIDLEDLAKHRGSVFGGLGQPSQPTVEQFENNLFLQWRNLRADLPVWIEGESRSIGKVQIPQPLWDQMSAAPIIFLEVGRAQRIEFLIEEYGEFPTEQLVAAIEKLRKRLGGARLQAALAALACGDIRSFATHALQYYDKSYSRSLEKFPPQRVVRLPLNEAGKTGDAAALISLADQLTKKTEAIHPTRLTPIG